MHNSYIPTILTIAGSDPYGGAGIQVDSKVIHALGGYAFSVTTALTAQNSTGVKNISVSSLEHFKLELHTILDDIKIDAVKIGMLANSQIIEVVIDAIEKYRLKNIVLDTVLVSSSGKDLLESKGIDLIISELFNKVDLITPNLPEINRFLNKTYSGEKEEIEEIAQQFFAWGVKAVLIKGGHNHEKNYATDYLVRNREKPIQLRTNRVATSHTHGTGCVLSSAIATYLAKGESLENSVQLAKAFLYEKLQTASKIKFTYTDEKCERKEPLL